MEDLIRKENEIFDILNEFLEEDLTFIIVGGYAVSAYKHRFSVDADIVIQSKDIDKFKLLLKKENFKKTISKDLENVYFSKFIRYKKENASVDMLIDALASRNTDASFGFDSILKNSKKRKIIGIEKQITLLVPVKELLIAMKIHSGRLTDFRDIAALAKGTDLQLIKDFIDRGDTKKVKMNLENLEATIKNPNFINSFKGVFMEKNFDIDIEQVKKISELKDKIK
ncbi:hypothetical protein J4217_00390 [Candidatus Pacearchaeota archaeon]|nr:hypothetical protein [Candidatus Pacearchaeota archaeon]